MKNTKDFTTVVMEKKAMLEVLEALMEKLSSIEEDINKDWQPTGEKEQATSWDANIKESRLVWLDEDGKRTFEDTGRPCMKDCYDYLPKKNFTEQENAKLAAIEKVRDTLAALA